MAAVSVIASDFGSSRWIALEGTDPAANVLVADETFDWIVLIAPTGDPITERFKTPRRSHCPPLWLW